MRSLKSMRPWANRQWSTNKQLVWWAEEGKDRRWLDRCTWRPPIDKIEKKGVKNVKED